MHQNGSHGGEDDASSAESASTALLTQLCVDAAGVDGAAVAVIGGSPLVRDLLYSTDAVATRLDELQFTIGEGPCLEAYRTGDARPVPDLTDRTSTVRWPTFAAAVLEELSVSAVFAYPLTVDTAPVGALELYRAGPGPLTVEQHTTVETVAAMLGPALIAESVDVHRIGGSTGAELPGALPARATRFSREDVHTAIGLLAARLTIPIDDAAALLRGYAYAESASVTDVAHRIVQRTLDPGLLDDL